MTDVKFPPKFPTLPSITSIMRKRGVPPYPSSVPLKLSDLRRFRRVEENHSVLVPVDTQVEWAKQMWTGDCGWLCFMCGDYSRMRNFCIKFLFDTHEMHEHNYNWVAVNSSRNQFTTIEGRMEGVGDSMRIVVLDFLNVYRSKSGNLDFDRTKVEKILDVITYHRRLDTSIIVLCPDIEPAESLQILKHPYDFAMDFKPRQSFVKRPSE